MKGKIEYRIKDRQNGGTEENWVKDFANIFQLVRWIYVAVKRRAETIHFFYSKK